MPPATRSRTATATSTCPKSPRMYKNKAKNAQEAHECIRPTEMTKDAGALRLTDADQRKLYDLIWKRTLACQMEAARLERTTVEIGSRRQAGRPARDRSGRALRRVPEGLRGGPRRALGRRGRQPPAADPRGRQDAVRQGRPARPSSPRRAKRTTTRGREHRRGQRPQRQGRDRRKTTPFSRSSTTPSRRRAIPRRRWSRRWKSSASAAPRPMPACFPRSRTANTSARTGTASSPRTRAGSSRIFLLNFFKRYVEYDFTAEPRGGTRPCQRRPARLQGASARSSGAISRPRSRRPPNCASPRCWTCSTTRSRRRSIRRARTGAIRASVRSAARAACTSRPRARAASSAARAIPNAATPAPSAAMPASGRPRSGRGRRATRSSLRSGRFGPYVQRGEATEEQQEAAAREPAQGMVRRGDGPREGADAAVACRAGGHPPRGRRADRGRASGATARS